MVTRKNTWFLFHFFFGRSGASRNKDEKEKDEAYVMFESQALKLSNKIKE